MRRPGSVSGQSSVRRCRHARHALASPAEWPRKSGAQRDVTTGSVDSPIGARPLAHPRAETGCSGSQSDSARRTSRSYVRRSDAHASPTVTRRPPRSSMSPSDGREDARRWPRCRRRPMRSRARCAARSILCERSRGSGRARRRSRRAESTAPDGRAFRRRRVGDRRVDRLRDRARDAMGARRVRSRGARGGAVERLRSLPCAIGAGSSVSERTSAQ